MKQAAQPGPERARARGAGLLLLALLAFAVAVRGGAIMASTGAARTPVRGAPQAYERLLKLRTTASVLHTTAHPDDEHGGVMARLSRGLGARLGLLCLGQPARGGPR